jgi:hypothetical protein
VREPTVCSFVLTSPDDESRNNFKNVVVVITPKRLIMPKTNLTQREISDSQGCEYKDDSFLGYSAM